MKYLICGLLFCLWSAPLFAQEDTIRTEEVEIVKDYTPFLEEGRKQQFSPKMPEIIPNNRENLNYQVDPQFLTIDYRPDRVDAIPLELNNEVESTNIYFKGGYGTQNNPLAQLAISGSEKNNFSAGVLGNYQGIEGDDFQFQQANQASLQVFGEKEVGSSLLKAVGHFKQQQNWLFGYDQNSFEIPEDDLNQRINQFGATIGAESITSESPLNYDVNARLNLLNGRLFDFEETQIGLTSDFAYQWNDEFTPQLHVAIDSRNTKTPLGAQEEIDGIVFHGVPSVKYSGDIFQAELGVSFNNDEDNDFKFFPHIKAELPLSGGQYTAYAGWTGKTEINGMQQITAVNPRLDGGVQTRNFTREQRAIGIRGNLSDEFSFQVQLAQEIQENAPLFFTTQNTGDPSFGSRFDVLAEEQLTAFTPSVALDYQNDKLLASFGLKYNSYDTDVNAEAWHLPVLDANFSVDFQPIEKLTLRSTILALSGIEANEQTTLDGLTNINLGAEYQITENIGVFLDGNNLANQDAARWVNYPMIGTAILGGVVVRY